MADPFALVVGPVVIPPTFVREGAYVAGPAGPTGPTGGSVALPNQSGSTIPAGSPVGASSGSAGVLPASAAASGQLPAVGVAAAGAGAGGAVTVRTAGPVTLADWTAAAGTVSLSPNAVYFVSAAQPGRLTVTAPSGAGQVAQAVGRAVTSDTLLVGVGVPVRL